MINDIPSVIVSRLVFDSTGCWLWTGPKSNGYGQLVLDGITKPVARVVYEISFGPVEPDLEVVQVCRVRYCVNPTHLTIMTQALATELRSLGSVRLDKTHCPTCGRRRFKSFKRRIKAEQKAMRIEVLEIERSLQTILNASNRSHQR